MFDFKKEVKLPEIRLSNLGEFVKRHLPFLGESNKHMSLWNATEEKLFLTDTWEKLPEKYKDILLLNDEYSGLCLTASQFYEKIIHFAAGLQALGVKKGTKVAQFAESSAKWVVVDQAIIACGALNAVRGSQGPGEELNYIYKHSDSVALVTDNIKLIDTLSKHLSKEDTLFILYIGEEDISGHKKLMGIPVYTFEDFDKFSEDKKYKKPEIYKDDPLTIVYSSGTTGRPKGVVLSHGNIVSQLHVLHLAINFESGKRALSILPVWHMYERTCAYYLLSEGCLLNYTNLRNFKKDLQKYKPNYMITVPRLWILVHDSIMAEIKTKPLITQAVFNTLLAVSKICKKARRKIKNQCIYSQDSHMVTKVFPFVTAYVLKPIDAFSQAFVYKKAKDAMGGQFIKGISGGGALPHYIEDFFEALGIKILVGYGLTETAPVLSVRRDDANRIYSVGPALAETEFKIVDPETFVEVPQGEKGLVLTRGPQVMLGYYKNEEATREVIRGDWFITGDLGWLTKDSDLVLTGRQKEIIVLQNGENIEAVALEDVCQQNPFVEQIVITGQDMISLTAIIVPNMDEVLRVLPNKANANLNDSSDFKAMLMNELNQAIKARKSFRVYEILTNIYFTQEAFAVDNGLLTQSMKIRKNNVIEKYKNEISSMYKR